MTTGCSPNGSSTITLLWTITWLAPRASSSHAPKRLRMLAGTSTLLDSGVSPSGPTSVTGFSVRWSISWLTTPRM